MRRGRPITIHNLIAPTIDGVLGMEAKSRTDLMVIADDHDDGGWSGWRRPSTLNMPICAAWVDWTAPGEAYGGPDKGQCGLG